MVLVIVYHLQRILLASGLGLALNERSTWFWLSLGRFSWLWLNRDIFKSWQNFIINPIAHCNNCLLSKCKVDFGRCGLSIYMYNSGHLVNHIVIHYLLSESFFFFSSFRHTSGWKCILTIWLSLCFLKQGVMFMLYLFFLNASLVTTLRWQLLLSDKRIRLAIRSE